ncbi:MAG TPA: CHAT domain-containing protein [Pyrinomonadaceae bacterium]|nr:CHAT domain-containing protein [Pyrinomonadaceae bacterium]
MTAAAFRLLTIDGILCCVLIGTFHFGAVGKLFPETRAAGLGQISAPQELITLELSKPIERDLAGGDTHIYQLPLLEGQFISVGIKLRGLDVRVMLQPPGGDTVEMFKAIGTAQEALFTQVAALSGMYRLSVHAPGTTPAGRYEIRLIEARAATMRDRQIVEATRLFAEALRLMESEKYTDAVASAERAAQIFEQTSGAVSPEFARALSLLGNIHFQKQDYANAEETYVRASSILEKSVSDDSPQYSDALHSLAYLYDTKGDFVKAEQVYQRELASRQKAAGEDSLAAGRVLSYIARVHYRVGNYDEAESLYQRTLNISEKRNDENGALAALTNLAIIYSARGDYQRSEDIFIQVLEKREKAANPNQMRIAHALVNLGELNNSQGDYAAAAAYLKRSLSIIESIRKSEGGEHADILIRLAETHVGQSDYAAAEQTARRALAIRERINGSNHPYVAQILNQLGRIAYLKGNGPDAEVLYRRAVEVAEKSQGVGGPEALAPLKALAVIYAERGDEAQAIDFQTRARSADERNLSLALATGSERQKLTYLAAAITDVDRSLTLHVRHAPANQQAAALALVSVLRFKGRVLDSLTDTLNALRRRATPEDKALLDQLSEVTSLLARRVLSDSQSFASAEDRAKTEQLEERRAKLEDEISRRSAEFRSQKLNITLDSVRREIPEGAALIEFVVYRSFDPKRPDDKTAFGEPRYLAYVVPDQGEVRWVEIGVAKDIDGIVDALRRALGDSRRRDVRQLARNLDEKLMRPVRALVGDATRLLISPDGHLNLIPFEALVDEQGRYLLERYGFNYLTSGRDLLRLQVRRESKSPPVVVADPTFGDPALIDSSNSSANPSASNRAQFNSSQLFFGPLPGIADEVRTLKTLLPQATFLVKEQATEANLRRVRGPSILHIATHGFFLENDSSVNKLAAAKTPDSTRLGKWVANVENPLLRSGLALAGANQGRSGDDDGVLTALEATALDLWGTKLVVLSACDTGVGQVKNGEGVYGLRRALFLAGAESQLMSLWPVSDRSTRDLMTGYYQALVQDVGRGEALRQVQLKMLHNKPRSHPYYWASFILAGEWANLKGQR